MTALVMLGGDNWKPVPGSCLGDPGTLSSGELVGRGFLQACWVREREIWGRPDFTLLTHASLL